MPNDKAFSAMEVGHLLAQMAGADGTVTLAEREQLWQFSRANGLDFYKLFNEAKAIAEKNEKEVSALTASERKGRAFEEMVVGLLADKERTTLLAWRGDKTANGVYAKDALLPDLQIEHRLERHTVQYMVECKYRSEWCDGAVDITGQFLRYYFAAKDAQQELFIALGIGGTPSAPAEFYLIPSRMIDGKKPIQRERIVKCQLPDLTSAIYHRYINHYFERRVFNNDRYNSFNPDSV